MEFLARPISPIAAVTDIPPTLEISLGETTVHCFKQDLAHSWVQPANLPSMLLPSCVEWSVADEQSHRDDWLYKSG